MKTIQYLYRLDWTDCANVENPITRSYYGDQSDIEALAEIFKASAYPFFRIVDPAGKPLEDYIQAHHDGSAATS